ncbi:MAG TPA: tetratricopeptide repeat protein [Methylotenera sp.]|nr:tetratricopeptide repeat protein [Methylotenera sp.]
MKKYSKLFTFIVATGAIASCATDQKTTKLEIAPMPYQIKACYNKQALTPECIKTTVSAAALDAERGDFKESISQLKGLLAKQPDDAYLYNNLGYAYYLSGNYNEAASTLGKAIVIDPSNVRALNNMGAALNKLGKTENAKKYFALAKTIKIGKIRPVDEQSMPAADVKPVSEQSALVETSQSAQPTLTLEPRATENPASGEMVIVKNSPTEIKQLSSGIYEIVKTVAPIETVVMNAPVSQPVPEVKILAQSGGISFKVHPLVNNLFNEGALAMAIHSELNNKLFTLEIVNGNGVKGFAKKTGETLAEIGLNQPYQVTNKKRYNQYTTVLQYKVGYREEAIQLAKTLNRMPVLVKFNAMANNSDMRLVLGRDVINPYYMEQYSAS